jgi:hypothetical protein
MSEGEYINSLIDEYRTLLASSLLLRSVNREYDELDILKDLTVSAD